MHVSWEIGGHDPQILGWGHGRPWNNFIVIAYNAARQSWGLRGRFPHILGKGSWEVSGGSWTGREILLYLFMYRKYVRKWWLLKRNRIICPEVAVSGQFLPGKAKKLLWNCFKSRIFSYNLPRKIEMFWWNCLKNRNFFGNLSGKIEFFTRIHDLQISNQIDAAAIMCRNMRWEGFSKVVILRIDRFVYNRNSGDDTLNSLLCASVCGIFRTHDTPCFQTKAQDQIFKSFRRLWFNSSDFKCFHIHNWERMFNKRADCMETCKKQRLTD